MTTSEQRIIIIRRHHCISDVNNCTFREADNAKLQSKISGLNDEISRLGEEKADLMVKIEVGEGASTALAQLKQQNVSGQSSFLFI